MTAGYSGTPLPKKLGLKAGQTALLINVPGRLSEIGGFDGFASVITKKYQVGERISNPTISDAFER